MSKSSELKHTTDSCEGAGAYNAAQGLSDLFSISSQDDDV